MRYKILRSRKGILSPAIWNFDSQTAQKTEEFHLTRLTKAYCSFVNGMISSFYPEEDWNDSARKILQHILDDDKYIKSIFQKEKQICQDIMIFLDGCALENYKSKSMNELFNYYREFMNNWLILDEVNVLPWYVGGELLNETILSRLKSKGLSEEEIQNLLTCPERSFSMDEEKEFLDILMQLIKEQSNFNNLSDEIKKKIENLSKKYYWMPFGYDGFETFSPEYYTNKLQESISTGITIEEIQKKLEKIENYEKEIRTLQESLFEKFNLDELTKRLLADFHIISFMTDERKIYHFQIHYHFHKLLDEIALRLGLSMKEIKFLFLSELESCQDNVQKLKEISQYRINNHFIVLKEKDKEFTVLPEDEVKELAKIVFSKESKDVLKGVVASRSDKKVIGKARIAMHSSEISKVEKGDILIAPMTTPEYVPAMRIASAIITDEGGVTCHAAIIARELKIPCIIGTTHATRSFQDGDLVEVDTIQGTVRKISN